MIHPEAGTAPETARGTDRDRETETETETETQREPEPGRERNGQRPGNRYDTGRDVI